MVTCWLEWRSGAISFLEPDRNHWFPMDCIAQCVYFPARYLSKHPIPEWLQWYIASRRECACNAHREEGITPADKAGWEL